MTPRRMAIRAPNWLGDAVMAIPAMGAVRARYADASLTVVALPSVAPVFLEQTPASPDSVVALDGREETRLRQGRFDAMLLLPNSFRAAWVARRAGIAERWGYRSGGRGWLLTRGVRTPRGHVHQVEYYRGLVRALDIPPGEDAPRVAVSEETAHRAATLLREHQLAAVHPLVGFAPGAAYGHAKRWPPARVAQVIDRLTRETGAGCLLVGAGGDREAGREIESALPRDVRVVNLIGRTDLRVLAGVLAACDAFVSNDSGAMHLAAAVGVPVTAIFGPTDERETSPAGIDHDVLIEPVFCRPCMLRDCPIDHRCMKRITVDAVVASVRRHLEATS